MTQALLNRKDVCLIPLFEPFIRAKRPDILHVLDRICLRAAQVL